MMMMMMMMMMMVTFFVENQLKAPWIHAQRTSPSPCFYYIDAYYNLLKIGRDID